MKKFRYILYSIVWSIIGLYLLLMVALHLPSVQTYIGSQVASAIGQKLGTKGSVGRVAIGLFNH